MSMLAKAPFNELCLSGIAAHSCVRQRKKRLLLSTSPHRRPVNRRQNQLLPHRQTRFRATRAAICSPSPRHHPIQIP
jgi:hypothetical protein